MPDEQGLLTVMEYAVKWKLNTNSVQRMLQEKRLAGVKVGKSWRIPAGAIPVSKGEKSTEQVTTISTGVKAQVEPVVVGSIPPPDKQSSVEPEVVKDGIAEREEAVSASEAKVSSDRADVERRELLLDEWERGIKSEIVRVEKWLNRVRVLGNKADEIIADFVATISYDKGLAAQYLVDERHPQWTKAGKSLSIQGVRYRLDDLVKLIHDFAELPEPDFTFTQGDASGDFDEPDEQEPDKVDQEAILKQVEERVDREVEQVEAEVLEIIPKKRSKKQDGD